MFLITETESETLDHQQEKGSTIQGRDQDPSQGSDPYLETDHGPVTVCQLEIGRCLESVTHLENGHPQPITAVSVTDLHIQIIVTTNLEVEPLLQQVKFWCF